MSERNDLKEPKMRDVASCPYDFARAARILEAMDFLRREAVKTNTPDVVAMVDATFNLLVTTCDCILRHERTTNAGNEMVQ